MKSNKSISRKIFLTKFHFFQFPKWPKISFWTGKNIKTAKIFFWFIWFHKFFYLDFFKFSGPLHCGNFTIIKWWWFLSLNFRGHQFIVHGRGGMEETTLLQVKSAKSCSSREASISFDEIKSYRSCLPSAVDPWPRWPESVYSARLILVEFTVSNKLCELFIF